MWIVAKYRMLIMSSEIANLVANLVRYPRKEYGRKMLNLKLKMRTLCKVRCLTTLEKKKKKYKRQAQ